MGGEYRQIRIYGPDLNTAWRRLQEEEEVEKGSDFYNGSAHHVHDIRLKSSRDYDSIVNNGSLAKCTGIVKVLSEPIGNENKIKTQVENFPQVGTRKWVTKYVVSERWSGKICGYFDKQDEAINKARKLSEKDRATYIVEITKKLESGNQKVAEISYKKSSKEKDGSWEVYCLVPW